MSASHTQGRRQFLDPYGHAPGRRGHDQGPGATTLQGESRDDPDHRYAPAPLGPDDLPPPLAEGQPEAGPKLRDARLPRGHRGLERRQVDLHGSGRRTLAAARRGRSRHRDLSARRHPDGGRRDLGPSRLGRIQGLHHPVQAKPLHQGRPPGAPRPRDPARLLPGRAVHRGDSPAGHPGPELRHLLPLHATCATRQS